MPEKHTTHDIRLKRGHQRRSFVCICKYISKYQNLRTTWYREINLNNSHCKIGYVIGYFEIRIFRKLKQCCFFLVYKKFNLHTLICNDLITRSFMYDDFVSFVVNWNKCYYSGERWWLLMRILAMKTTLFQLLILRGYCFFLYYPNEIAKCWLLTHFVEQKVFTNLTLVF